MTKLSQREHILSALESSSCVYFDDKRVLGRWSETLRALERDGLVEIKLVEIEEQYSRLEVRRKKAAT